MDLSIQVIKEPRGFIRILQCIMAILAFSTTAGFNTECEFSISWGEEKEMIHYEFGYPFLPTELKVPFLCGVDKKYYSLPLPFDYSSASEFYVATGVLAFLYSIIALVLYIFFHQLYANNTKVPALDLGITAILSVFWMAASSAWAQGVTDLKYYLHPDKVFKFLPNCLEEDRCHTEEDGSYGVLHASLVLGFANFLLWTCSLWFVYKETVFHTPEAVPEIQPPQSTKSLPRV